MKMGISQVAKILVDLYVSSNHVKPRHSHENGNPQKGDHRSEQEIKGNESVESLKEGAWIDTLLIGAANLEVKVGSSGTASVAGKGNDISLFDLIPDTHQNFAVVRINCGPAILMENLHHPAMPPS